MPYIIDSVTIEVYKETYEDGKGRRLSANAGFRIVSSP